MFSIIEYGLNTAKNTFTTGVKNAIAYLVGFFCTFADETHDEIERNERKIQRKRQQQHDELVEQEEKLKELTAKCIQANEETVLLTTRLENMIIQPVSQKPIISTVVAKSSMATTSSLFFQPSKNDTSYPVKLDATVSSTNSLTKTQKRSDMEVDINFRNGEIMSELDDLNAGLSTLFTKQENVDYLINKIESNQKKMIAQQEFRRK